MRRTYLALALVLLLLTARSFAHGNMNHILGTVKQIAGNVVTVEKKGKTTEVTLTVNTTWESDGKPGKQGDLKVGDRVVIHAVKVGGKEVAHEVRFAHTGGAR
jgi:hypothetical protein